MARRSNLKYTAEMRSYIWDRYQPGDSPAIVPYWRYPPGRKETGG